MSAVGERSGEYVQTGPVRTYYEVVGDGDPLVLMHGGLCTVEVLGGLSRALAERFRVYSPERRGHGRTADVDGPITYANTAADTIAFIEAVGIPGAHLVGFSDGAAVAVHVALERPDLVSKLVLIGQALNHDGLPPGSLETLQELASNLPPMLRVLYESASPDGPEHFQVVVDKHAELWRVDPSFALEQLSAIAAPTLFMMGDRDMVTLEHAGAVCAALQDARLCVLPGTHMLPIEHFEVAGRVIREFLDGSLVAGHGEQA